MSRSGNRKNRHRQLQASHQKNWITGRYVILETLRSGRWPVQDLFLADSLDVAVAEEILTLAAAAECRVSRVSAERLEELCRSRHHQGLAARMEPYPYQMLDELLASFSDTAQNDDTSANPLVVICDRIQDAYNFGAILRCCDAMAVCAVVIADTDQTGVTPQVARSSSGAVNFVNVVMADELVDACEKLKQSGFTIAAASEKSESLSWQQSLTNRTALIVGSESHGVRDELLEQCDVHLRIPMMGHVESLNAAVAAGILLYEIRRQQAQ